MKHEFKKIKGQSETRYVLETASAGGTSAGSVASVSGTLGGVRKRDNLLAQEADKKSVPAPRNFVAKNAKMGGAGQHRDKKKEQKQGNEKHKKPYMEHGVAEGDHEPDHEIQMASSELQAIAKNAVNLLDLVRRYSEAEGLEAWQQSKITKAADYLNSVLQSISGEQGVAEAEKNPHTSALGKALYRDLSKEKKASPQQVQRNKERWAKRQAEREQGVAEGSSDFVENAIEDLRVSKPGMDIESFLDELYYYIDAEYGKQAADMVANADEDQQADWYDNYSDMAEDHTGFDKGWGQSSYDTYAGGNHGRGVAEDAYMESLAAKMAEKLDPNADPDVWVQDFQKADPNKYHQFKNKSPKKKAQMAVAARYAAKNPSKK